MENLTPQYWVENKEECCQKFTNETFWNQIPLINVNHLHNLKDNTLVRFHGMIQDMHNPEYYFAKYEVENEISKEKFIKCGKYRDTTDLNENEVINFNSCENETCERHTLVVISLPGLNEWVYNLEKEQCSVVPSSITDNLPKSTKHLLQNHAQKRPVDEEPMETDSTCQNETNSSSNTEHKKICTKKTESSTAIVSQDHILNFPISDENGKCCLVKIYENSDDFKLNDMIEIVGFLSVDPVLAETSYHNSEPDNEMELQTHNPPPSLVPRIHCVLFKKLKYINPLLKNISLGNEQVFNVYKELSVFLTQLLFGDKLAADYLICHLISKVYLRKDLMAIGKFTLNISNIPAQVVPEYGRKLYEFLQLVLPKSHYLPMTIEKMNDLAFFPKKDYECNRLTSGILQLSNNTHLVLDETKLQPGQLNNSGCQGIAALAATIKHQKVSYDFNYYQMEFDCDIPILIISEGTSLLPSDFHVPLKFDEDYVNTITEIMNAAKHFLKADLLNNLRVYVTKMRHAEYNLADDVLDLVQNEFVKLRQNDKKISADDLHQLLVLARLICLSQGKESLDEDCWRRACNMETERKARIDALPKRR